MFGISLTEMLAILIIAAVVLKPEDLPKVARALGRGLRFIRQTSAEARAVLSQGLAEETPARTAPMQAAPASPVSSGIMDAGTPLTPNTDESEAGHVPG